MARIKWNTTYSFIRTASGVKTGSFQLIRVRGELFFHESAKDWLIPVSSVIGATVSGGVSF